MAWVHREPFGQSAVKGMVDADPSAGAGLTAPVGSMAVLNTGIGQWVKSGAGDTAWARQTDLADITDPGDAGAIPVTDSGQCDMTSAGAETRTLAIPTFEGQILHLTCTVYVGDIVVTVASAIDTAGNTIITFGTAKDYIHLVAMDVGGALAWNVSGNSGCALT